MMENLRSFLFSRRCNHRFLKTNWPHSVRAAFRRYLLAFAWASVCASAAAQAPAWVLWWSVRQGKRISTSRTRQRQMFRYRRSGQAPMGNPFAIQRNALALAE